MTISGKGLSVLRSGAPKMINLSSEQFVAMSEYGQGRGDILALFIYGSYGTKYQTPMSDLDLAVLPLPDVKLDLAEELDITVRLMEICKTDHVNMINLYKVPVTLQMKVLEHGRLLYCADELQLADFVELVIKRYCDFAPDLKAIYEDYDSGLKEVFL